MKRDILIFALLIAHVSGCASSSREDNSVRQITCRPKWGESRLDFNMLRTLVLEDPEGRDHSIVTAGDDLVDLLSDELEYTFIIKYIPASHLEGLFSYFEGDVLVAIYRQGQNIWQAEPGAAVDLSRGDRGLGH